MILFFLFIPQHSHLSFLLKLLTNTKAVHNLVILCNRKKIYKKVKLFVGSIYVLHNYFLSSTSTGNKNWNDDKNNSQLSTEQHSVHFNFTM